MNNRTIAAIATPLGESAIGVIKISGDDAVAVADRVFKSFCGKTLKEMGGYTALYGKIINKNETVDTAVALKFVAPKSYTGEDVVELSVHGGRAIVKQVLRTVLENGAVAAGPGEFTKRAFLNGKLDLVKAEAVMGVISAQSESELKINTSAINGLVSKKIVKIRDELLEIAASIAFFTDNPDEPMPDLTCSTLLKRLNKITEKLLRLIKNYDNGRVIREGIDTVILGKPNVGKSTLMNLLSHRERSIVTDVAGTTRDIIEDTVTVGDIVLRLSDTAGIHKTDDIVENAGITLAVEKSKSAQLILAVFDISRPLDSDDFSLIESIKNKKCIAVLNKNDICESFNNAECFSGIPTVTVSAKNGTGEKELSEKIAEITGVCEISADTAMLGSERQRDCAVKAFNATEEAKKALQTGITFDAVGVLIDDALNALYSLTGERVTNEVADEVFKKFCVGK